MPLTALTCENCGRSNTAATPFCAYCGTPAPVPATSPPPPPPGHVDIRPWYKKKRWIFSIAAVTMVIWGAASGDSGGTGSSGGSSSSSSSDQKYAAFEMCKSFVKDRLKAPSTAKFRNYFEDDGEVRVSGFGDGPYIVISTVDSQNGFGAQIRGTFTCSVTNSSGDNWRLNSISVD